MIAASRPRAAVVPDPVMPPAALATLDSARPAAPRLPAAGEAPLLLERCAPGEVERHAEAWAGLAARALAPDPFVEPGFVLPALGHLGPAAPAGFLLCWERQGARPPVLVGLLALHRRGPLPCLPVAAAWHHPLTVLSAPLLDRARAAPALRTLMRGLAREGRGRAGLLLRGVPTDDALFDLLAAMPDLRLDVVATRSRAVLPAGIGDAGAPRRKGAKELRRQLRRLGDAGGVRVTEARGAEAVGAAVERFLMLEARGWKGRAGTALLSDPGQAGFTRAMTRHLAAQDRAHVHLLEAGEAVAAAGIVLRSGARAYFWKTAYDEAQARHSPGVLLTNALTEALRADPAIRVADSCAVPGHPMIDRLWTDRAVVADVLVSPRGAGRLPAIAATALRALGAGRRLAVRVRDRLTTRSTKFKAF